MVRGLSVTILRELFRCLQQWHAAFESHDVSDTLTYDGITYHLYDIDYLYSCRDRLSPRQAQAIELCLYQNMLERNAAQQMGVSETNPVAMYATNGLARLIDMIESGQLVRYREGDDL
jgi:DNA-directed RNA polymerase specialized sigma24 family protein